MKYVKVLGLLTAAAAMMGIFAASASATTVTAENPTTGVVTSQSQVETPTIHAVNENGHVRLHNSIANIECSSTVEGTVTQHGPAQTTSGPITHLTFNNCTNDWVVHVNSPGTLEIHHTGAGTGHGTGTLTSSGATVTATRFGIQCNYRTENTPIGHVLGGNPATLSISASIPRHGGSFLCGGGSATWTGSYVTTHTLAIHP